MSDEEGKWATPMEVVEVTSAEGAAARVLEVIRKEGVRRLLVGTPINMDDSIGGAAREAMRWGKEMGQRAGVEVVFVDERLSSFEAEQQLIERKRAGEKLTRQKKKKQLDAIAAASFLQAYLDGKIGGIEERDEGT